MAIRNMVLLAGLLLSLPGLPAAAQRPVVEVRFTVQASNFQTGLRASLGDLEKELSTEVARLGCRHLGFVDWRPVAGRAKGSFALDVVLKSSRSGNIDLHFYFTLARGAAELIEEQVRTVYAYHVVQPNDDHRRVERDLQGLLGELFADDAFRRKLIEDFLGRVPLARDLVYYKGQNRLFVPVTETELAAEDGTKLRADLFIAADGLREGGCRLQLEKRGPHQRMIQTHVLRSEIPSIGAPQDGWHEEIPHVLKRRAKDSLRVFMLDYRRHPYPQTAGSLVLSPNPRIGGCGGRP